MAADVGRRIGMGRLATVLTAMALGLAACSSGSDPGSEVAIEGDEIVAVDSAEESSGSDESSETSTAGAATEAPTDADLDCEPLYFNRGDYSTVAGAFTRSTTQAEAEAALAEITTAEMREFVDIYRPYQDVEGEVFGTLREGLDNLSVDIDAFEAGTFTGPTGESYKTASIAPVLQAIGC